MLNDDDDFTVVAGSGILPASKLAEEYSGYFCGSFLSRMLIQLFNTETSGPENTTIQRFDK